MSSFPSIGATGGQDFSSLGGSLGSLIGQLNWKNPVNSAMPYYNQIPDILKQYLSPYTNAGQGMIPILQGQYSQLTGNPGQMLNSIGQNFQQSPGYQFQVQQALKAANQASAAGGLAGSPQEQQQIAGVVNNLANQDYYNWLNGALGLYGQGLQGEQNMFGIGANAANNLASGLGQAEASMGNLAYQGTNLGNANNQGLWSSLRSVAGSLADLF